MKTESIIHPEHCDNRALAEALASEVVERVRDNAQPLNDAINDVLNDYDNVEELKSLVHHYKLIDEGGTIDGVNEVNVCGETYYTPAALIAIIEEVPLAPELFEFVIG